MARSISIVPAAHRLMESLRDIGYTLPAAVADLVDNSIDAGASRIDVDLNFEGERSWLRVSDDGAGMSGAHLDEAMRYGSRRTYEGGELGRFGLGLKTASLSQCRALTVATRRSPKRRRIEIRRWSLDHVEKSGDWDLLRLSPDECRAETLEPLNRHSGTVVFWEALDRVLRYRRPGGGAAENGVAGLSLVIADHLGVVFHRFLDGSARRRRRIGIFVNGDPVAAWDPFARREPATRALAAQILRISSPSGDRQVVVRPFVLPREDQFSDRSAHARAAGPRRWNRQQGLYIYRADRLIQGGGWSRLRAEDEHTKLARIALDIPPGCDELFEINVSKMRVTLPSALRPALKAIVVGVSAEAQTVYRRGREDAVRREPVDVALPPAVVSAPRRSEVPPADHFDRRLGLYWEEMEDVLTAELRGNPQLLSRVLRELRGRALWSEDATTLRAGIIGDSELGIEDSARVDVGAA